MTQAKQPPARRRGAQIAPQNRFESTRLEAELSDLEYDEDLRADDRNVKTEFITDHAKSILTTNDSPDICFDYSINPYRGCEHGCAYCYARPTHEALGMNAGIDFESKVM